MLRTRVPTWQFGYVCWQCQQRLVSQRRTFASATASATKCAHSKGERAIQRSYRSFHTTPPALQTSLSSASPTADNPFLLDPLPGPIRERLQRWQEENGRPNEDELGAFGNYPRSGETSNDLTKVQFRRLKSDEGSAEKEEWVEEHDDAGDLITIGLFLKRGDVVELQRLGSEPTVAVFVQQLGFTSQFFSVNGRWCHGDFNRISFAISGCVDPAMLDPVIPYLPTATEGVQEFNVHVPRDISAPVTDLLQELRDEAEKIYRENATVLDNAYATLADKTRTRMMTLNQIAKALLGRTDPSWKPTNAMLLAVRKALLHNGFRFSSDKRNQRLTNVFSIRPKEEVQGIETVHEWIRQYQTQQALSMNGVTDDDSRVRAGTMTQGAKHVSDFINKARRLVSLSRERRSLLIGGLSPTKARHPINMRSSAIQIAWGESFNFADKAIINFLIGAAIGTKFLNMPALHSAVSGIIQGMGLYEEEFARSIPLNTTNVLVQSFLQEIGVLMPYENRALYDEQLTLPTLRLSRNLELLHAKAELTRRSPDFRDSMADMRIDWGSTNVYCIDDTGAREIDDGVSVELVKGTESEYWVHVHVANPTAFFDKTHVLSGLAAHMTETVYTPERTFSMLPAWVSENHFSLRPNRPVLTFSTRINVDGAILERKIQPGIIRRVISMTPKELCEHFGVKDGRDTKKFIVGGEVPRIERTHTAPELSPKQSQELQDMYTISRVLWDMRKSKGGMKIGAANFDCNVYERYGKSGLSWNPPSLDKSRIISGDPIIELTTTSETQVGQQDHSPLNIVEEFMLLACSSAAAWCAERSIPVMYRGTVDNPMATLAEHGLSPTEFRSKVIEPYVEKHGKLSRSLIYAYMALRGRSIAHSSPITHNTIGVDSYVKVTSPLRRFSDMIAHWQIEAALRYEARSGISLKASEQADATRPTLPFSLRQIQDSIITLLPREKIISTAKTSAKQYWAVQAIARSFYFNEALLPKTFRVWIRQTRGLQTALGVWLDYAIPVRVRLDAGFRLDVGDEYEAEIESVDLYNKIVLVRPLCLLTKDTWLEEFKDVLSKT